MADRLRFLTVEDIRDILKIGKNTAYALMHSDAFPSFRIGRRLFISEENFREWAVRYVDKTFII